MVSLAKIISFFFLFQHQEKVTLREYHLSFEGEHRLSLCIYFLQALATEAMGHFGSICGMFN